MVAAYSSQKRANPNAPVSGGGGTRWTAPPSSNALAGRAVLGPLSGGRKKSWAVTTCTFARQVLLFALLIWMLPLSGPLRAQTSDEFPEYQLKAAFLYNFAKFITWPSNSVSHAPLTIAVLGDDPFGPLLPATIAGKTVNGRPLKVSYLRRGDSTEGADILFISRSERDRLPAILAEVKGKRILTVGDSDRFAHRGGMINLILVEKSVRFEMNVEAIERAGLKVNSKLGNLGIVVKPEEERK